MVIDKRQKELRGACGILKNKENEVEETININWATVGCKLNIVSPMGGSVVDLWHFTIIVDFSPQLLHIYILCLLLYVLSYLEVS